MGRLACKCTWSHVSFEWRNDDNSLMKHVTIYWLETWIMTHLLPISHLCSLTLPRTWSSNNWSIISLSHTRLSSAAGCEQTSCSCRLIHTVVFLGAVFSLPSFFSLPSHITNGRTNGWGSVRPLDSSSVPPCSNQRGEVIWNRTPLVRRYLAIMWLFITDKLWMSFQSRSLCFSALTEPNCYRLDNLL